MLNVKKLTIASLLASDSRSASADGTGVLIKDYIGNVAVTLDCEGGGGTSPTNDVKLQESASLSTGYTDIAGATFTQVVDTPALFETIFIDTRAIKAYVRAVSTLGGTSPVFVSSVTMVGEKQLKA